MCEVPDQASFLRDVDRILKPGGKIVFQEHVRAPEGSFLGEFIFENDDLKTQTNFQYAGSFQDIFNVWWKTASDGCNCNRRTLQSLKSIKGWNVASWALTSENPIFIKPFIVGIVEKEVESSISKM